MSIDQIVLSPSRYLSTSPGMLKNDQNSQSALSATTGSTRARTQPHFRYEEGLATNDMGRAAIRGRTIRVLPCRPWLPSDGANRPRRLLPDAGIGILERRQQTRERTLIPDGAKGPRRLLTHAAVLIRQRMNEWVYGP